MLNNQLCTEPDAGKPHVRFYRGVWGAIPISTRLEQSYQLVAIDAGVKYFWCPNHKNGTLIRYENPEESVYYETIGRVNLNDLTVFGSEEESEFLNYFNTIPMSIIEVKDGQIHFVRSNRSYLEFLRRIFGENLTVDGMNTSSDQYQTTSNFMSKIVACCRSGNRAFFDDVIPDGSVVHYYVRRVGTNPMTGSIAVAVAVLSITETSDEAIYSRIARALATDYYHLYYVDLETDRYIEYSSPAGGEELAVEQHGEGFFASREAVCRARLYEEDQDLFISNFTKENILHDIDEKGAFTLIYRLIDGGVPVYAGMKAVRIQSDVNHLIVAVSIIDSQKKSGSIQKVFRNDWDVYAGITALAGDYLSLYLVDPKTDSYKEYVTTNEYESLGIKKEGNDFFRLAIQNSRSVICQEDLPGFIREFDKEKILQEIHEKGIHQQHYRLMIKKKPRPVSLRIAMVKDQNGELLIAGVRAWKERR